MNSNEENKPEPYIPEPFGVHLKREYNFVFTKPVIMPIKSEQLRKIDKQQKELERAVTAQKY